MTKKILFLVLLSGLYLGITPAAQKSAQQPSGKKVAMAPVAKQEKKSKEIAALAEALPIKPLQKIVMDYVGDEWEKVQTIPTSRSSTSVALSQDGKYLAFGGFKWAPSQIFEFKDGRFEYLQDFTVDKITSLAFSSDNTYFATGDSDGTITLWKRTNGKFKLAQTFPKMGFDIALMFSDDGRYLIGASRTCGEFFIFEFDSDTDSYNEKKIDALAKLRIENAVISPDNKYIGVISRTFPTDGSSGGLFQILELKNGSYIPTQEFQLEDEIVYAMGSASGRFAVGQDKIRIYNLKNGKFSQNQVLDTSALPSLSFTRDGEYLAISGPKNSKIFQFINGQYMHKQDLDTGGTAQLAFSGYGSLLASIDFFFQKRALTIWRNTKLELEKS